MKQCEYNKQFDGPACLAMQSRLSEDVLMEADMSEQLARAGNSYQQHKRWRIDRHAVIQPWVDVFAALANVVTSTFGYELLDRWENNVAKLADAWRQVCLSIISKEHIVFEHLVPFCRQHGRGLGLYSEQTFEAIHYHFNELWKRYVVTDPESPGYIPRLKMSLVDFNGRNL